MGSNSGKRQHSVVQVVCYTEENAKIGNEKRLDIIFYTSSEIFTQNR